MWSLRVLGFWGGFGVIGGFGCCGVFGGFRGVGRPIEDTVRVPCARTVTL